MDPQQFHFIIASNIIWMNTYGNLDDAITRKKEFVQGNINVPQNLLRLAELHFRKGEYPESLQYLEQTLTQVDYLQAEEKIEAQQLAGHLAFQRKEYGTQQKNYREALELSLEKGQEWGYSRTIEANSRILIGNSYVTIALYNLAKTYCSDGQKEYEIALEIGNEIGFKRIKGQALLAKFICHIALNQIKLAKASGERFNWFNLANSIKKEVEPTLIESDDKYSILILRYYQALTHTNCGDLKGAYNYIQMAKQLNKEIGDPIPNIAIKSLDRKMLEMGYVPPPES